jgi:hypothetical protein
VLRGRARVAEVHHVGELQKSNDGRNLAGQEGLGIVSEEVFELITRGK